MTIDMFRLISCPGDELMSGGGFGAGTNRNDKWLATKA